MKLTTIFAAALLLGMTGQAARAQIPGLPFYPTPTGLGVMVSADYADPGHSTSLYALRAGLGFSRFGVTAVAGGYKVSSLSAKAMYGATAAMKLFGGGVLPVSIAAQAGVGQVKDPLSNTTTTFVPVGAAARLNVPLFPLKPFAVGYYTLGSSGVKNEVRVTVGADFNVLMGLGVHAAYDMGKDDNSWGVGAHLNFRLPSM